MVFITKNEGQFPDFNNQECEYKIEGTKNDQLEQGGHREDGQNEY